MEGRKLYFEFRLDFNTSESTQWDIQNPKVWRAHIQPLWEYMNVNMPYFWPVYMRLVYIIDVQTYESSSL